MKFGMQISAVMLCWSLTQGFALAQETLSQESETIGINLSEMELLAKKKKAHKKLDESVKDVAEGADKNKKVAEAQAAVGGIWGVMPLGLGQFMQGKTFRGLFYGAAQAAGAGFFFVSYSNQSSVKSEGEDYSAQRASKYSTLQSASGTTQTDLDNFNAETNAQIDSYNASIASENQNIFIGAGIMVAGYLLSMIDFYAFPLEDAKLQDAVPGKKKKGRKKSSKAAFLDLEEEIITEKFASAHVPKQFHLGIDPLWQKDKPLSLSGMLVSASYKF